MSLSPFLNPLNIEVGIDGFKVLVLWDNCSDENNIEKCKNFILNNE